jgi:hypothetical protein
MGAEFSPKIAIVDESPIRAAVLEEGLRAADSTDVVWIDEMQSVLSRIHALDPHVIDRTGSGLKERSVIDRAKGILMKLKGLTEEEAYVRLLATAMCEKEIAECPVDPDRADC